MSNHFKIGNNKLSNQKNNKAKNYYNITTKTKIYNNNYLI